MKRFVAIVAIVVVVGGLVAVVFAFSRPGEPVVQPIAFNHVVHVEDAKLECVECHRNAGTRVFAGLPGKDICFECHDIDDEQNTNPEKDKLFAFDERDDDIPWQRVTRTRPDVFFSHRRHVAAGKIECLECHRDQRTLVAPPPYNRLVMRMNDCLACHQRKGVSTDCLICHR